MGALWLALIYWDTHHVCQHDDELCLMIKTDGVTRPLLSASSLVRSSRALAITNARSASTARFVSRLL